MLVGAQIPMQVGDPMQWISVIVVGLYGLCVMMLSVYGIYTLVLTLWSWQARFRQRARPTPPPPATWPMVTVQLPIYNEYDMLERLLETVLAFDYPRECLQVQILDDSIDETAERARHLAETYTARGFIVEHLHRTDRSGFKAGALAAAMPHVRGEFTVIFDADFLPPRDFLHRTLPWFADPQIACVQARWGHLNPDYSLLTQSQALVLDSHFVLEQPFWEGTHLFMMFNGSGGIWRKSAIDAAGGWQGDTITEDLDLCYRAQMLGWKLMFLSDLLVPGELPVQFDAWRKQQSRWAKGNFQAAVKLSDAFRRAPVPVITKLAAFLHMTKYSVQPLGLLVMFLTPVMAALHLLAPEYLSITIFGSIGPQLMFVTAQLFHPQGRARRLLSLPMLYLINVGIMLSNTVAIVQALRGAPSVFERTPKFGVRGAEGAWAHSRYALSHNSLVWVELLCALYALTAIWFAWQNGTLVYFPWLVIYAAGFSFVAGLSLWQDWQRARWSAVAAEERGKGPQA